MSILHKLFGGPAAQQQAPSAAQGANPSLQMNQPGTPGNIPQNNSMPANPNNPTVPVDTANTTPEPKGLDKFTDMWNLKPEEKPKEPVSPFAAVTPEQVREIAGKTDFSKVVTPEMMAAISAGGEGAVAATLQAMNAMVQENYATSAQASMRLIDTALAKQREELTAQLPSLIKNQNVTENLRNTNPIFKHPAAEPMLDMFAKQLQLKNPTADAATIQEKAKEFLISFAEAANPAKVEKPNESKTGKTDWSDFF